MKAAKALAIQYREDFPAPLICAKGRGDLAERLIEIARKHGIEVVKEEAVTEGLFHLERGDFIPPEYYAAIAEMIAFVYKVRKER
jgi:type III secretion system FlhB-like substrate exporter